MNAIQIHRFGSPEVLEWNSLPDEQPKPFEVAVRIQMAALNPKDALVRKGKFTLFTGKKFPQRLGHDFAGEVVATGSQVKDLSIGDKVFGMINSWKAGAYADRIVVPAQEIARMPSTMSFEQGAAIPLAALTALQALRDLGKLSPGQSVFIHGASGGVGTFAVQIAKLLGATVTATSSSANHALLRELGADEVLDYAHDDLFKDKGRYAVFFDVFGNQSLQKTAPILQKKALYISTIPSLSIVQQVFTTYFSSKKVKLVVVKSNRTDLDWLAQQFEAGKLRAIIDQVFPIEQVAEAHRALETKRTKGKILLQIPPAQN
ncbi:MAG TPA: zinc-binding alcohol dehydrogenase [Microscillaceae bacterium]|jgi:NADPH:quinone reductase-like Zn-dependent oxidoreductase|nr:zinc-binding alcohol dehydrogenase [Microscillaceae bacterium]